MSNTHRSCHSVTRLSVGMPRGGVEAQGLAWVCGRGVEGLLADLPARVPSAWRRWLRAQGVPRALADTLLEEAICRWVRAHAAPL